MYVVLRLIYQLYGRNTDMGVHLYDGEFSFFSHKG